MFCNLAGQCPLQTFYNDNSIKKLSQTSKKETSSVKDSITFEKKRDQSSLTALWINGL